MRVYRHLSQQTRFRVRIAILEWRNCPPRLLRFGPHFNEHGSMIAPPGTKKSHEREPRKGIRSQRNPLFPAFRALRHGYTSQIDR